MIFSLYPPIYSDLNCKMNWNIVKFFLQTAYQNTSCSWLTLKMKWFSWMWLRLCPGWLWLNYSWKDKKWKLTLEINFGVNEWIKMNEKRMKIWMKKKEPKIMLYFLPLNPLIQVVDINELKINYFIE